MIGKWAEMVFEIRVDSRAKSLLWLKPAETIQISNSYSKHLHPLRFPVFRIGQLSISQNILTSCHETIFDKQKSFFVTVDGVEIEKSDTPGGVKTVHLEKADAQPGTSNTVVETDHIHLDTAKTAMDHDISSKTVDIEEVKAIQDTNK